MREGRLRSRRFVWAQRNERLFLLFTLRKFFELHVWPHYIGALDLEVLQLWRRRRKVSEQGFEVREVRINRRPPEAKRVVERSDRKERSYAVLATEVLIDVEELVPRSTEEIFCLLRFLAV